MQMRPLTVDDAHLAMVIFAVAIAVVPKVRHFLLFIKLQISLINRLGPIWEEGPGIRNISFFQSNVLSDLDRIEEKYGPLLTDQEKGWMLTSRRQHNIAFKWAVAVFCVLVLLMFLIR